MCTIRRPLGREPGPGRRKSMECSLEYRTLSGRNFHCEQVSSSQNGHVRLSRTVVYSTAMATRCRAPDFDLPCSYHNRNYRIGPHSNSSARNNADTPSTGLLVLSSWLDVPTCFFTPPAWSPRLIVRNVAVRSV